MNTETTIMTITMTRKLNCKSVSPIFSDEFEESKKAKKDTRKPKKEYQKPQQKNPAQSIQELK